MFPQSHITRSMEWWQIIYHVFFLKFPANTCDISRDFFQCLLCSFSLHHVLTISFPIYICGSESSITSHSSFFTSPVIQDYEKFHLHHLQWENPDWKTLEKEQWVLQWPTLLFKCNEIGRYGWTITGHSEGWKDKYFHVLLTVRFKFFGLHIDVDNFRKRFTKGLDEVHPFSDTPSVNMVLADAKWIFTSPMENVSVMNISRICRSS